MNQLFRAVLRRLPSRVLAALKRELRDYDAGVKQWDYKRKRSNGESVGGAS